jgi:hypothetical protein
MTGCAGRASSSKLIETMPFDPQTLEKWLGGEGWPEERRGQLAFEYERGRALLAHYEEEQGVGSLRI